jgi:DNA-binding transcriptional regulator GbsR (MarR family)
LFKVVENVKSKGLNSKSFPSTGRDFKNKYENLLKESTEKNTAIAKLEEQLKKLQEDLNKTESEQSAARSDVVSSPDDRLAEAETLVEQVCPLRQCFFFI